MVDHEGCDKCMYVERVTFRLDTMRKDFDRLDRCYGKMKNDIAQFDKNQAVIINDLKTIKAPLWIIATAVLLWLAQSLLKLIPTLPV